MSKKLFLIASLLGFINFAFAQEVTIVSKESQKPLEGVHLISNNSQKILSTDAYGVADISVFKNAARIEISSMGFKTLILSYRAIQNKNFKLELEESSFTLDQIVISATRWEQRSSNVPSKIISIDPKEVALQNPQTAADLLSLSGKVFVQKSQQGGGSPMIRGFATNRLIYTVDGVRMNTAIFRSGNIQNVINLDPFATESTEVLFGPGSVIYGSDAIGGVMSFQTLTPTFSNANKVLVKGKANARFSSANNEKTGHFDINLGWKKWAFVTSFSRWDYGDLKQGSNGPLDYVKDYYVERQGNTDVVIQQDDPLLQIPSGYTQANFMQKVRFKPNKSWDFQYGFHFSETSSYGRYDRHNRVRNGTARYAEWNYGPQKWIMNNLSISHNNKNAFYDQMNLRLAQQSFRESRIDRAFNDNERTTNSENVEAYSVNLDFTKPTSDKNSIFYGAEFIYNDVNSKGLITDISNGNEQTGPSRYPNATWKSLAVYVNDELSISDQLTLQGGLRYNQFILNADFSNNANFYPFPFTESTINNGSVTGSIGAVYKPEKTWIIKANFGTAFRSPNVDDIGKVFDSEPGAVVVPNPDLKAEYAYNFDLGFAKIIDDAVKLDVTGFYTILNNAMVRRNFQLNGLDEIIYNGTLSQVQALQNAASAKVYGAQAGVEVKLPNGFTLLSNINYQKGEEELDDGSKSPSRHAAPLFGVTRLRYRTSGLTLELNSIYQGEQSHKNLSVSERNKDEIYALDENGNTYSPSWYTLNFKAMFDFSKSISVSGGVENITDQRYRPYSSGLSGAGRNFILALTARF